MQIKLLQQSHACYENIFLTPLSNNYRVNLGLAYFQPSLIISVYSYQSTCSLNFNVIYNETFYWMFPDKTESVA